MKHGQWITKIHIFGKLSSRPDKDSHADFVDPLDMIIVLQTSPIKPRIQESFIVRVVMLPSLENTDQGILVATGGTSSCTPLTCETVADLVNETLDKSMAHMDPNSILVMNAVVFSKGATRV